MSAALGHRFTRRAVQRVAASTSTQARRSFATHEGPWPGPNPLKDIFIGLSIGLLFGVAFKSWQIKDKAERVRFYSEYERANRVEDALEAKRLAAQKAKEEEQPEEEGEEEEAETA